MATGSIMGEGAGNEAREVGRGWRMIDSLYNKGGTIYKIMIKRIIFIFQ